MTLLESLLDAIVRLEGDALVMHVGEKPYVVTTSSSMNAMRGPLAWGQVELSSRVLTSEAVLSMVGQILPADQRQVLDDLGAVEHEISAPHGVNDRFSVVAARGGDDIWLELRRQPAPAPEPAIVQSAAMGAAEASADVTESGSVAVGLQEQSPMPPPGNDSPIAIGDSGADDEAPTVVEAAIAESTVEETTIEERVPVLDEVGSHAPEHVEHILIPVTVHDDDAPEEDTAFELVDPETQHLPTDADVDALLAATASTLFAAVPDASGAYDADADAPTELFLIEPEEVTDADASESTAEAAEVAAETDVIDLGPALDEIPPSTWSPELSETRAPTQPEPVSSMPEPVWMPPPVTPPERTIEPEVPPIAARSVDVQVPPPACIIAPVIAAAGEIERSEQPTAPTAAAIPVEERVATKPAPDAVLTHDASAAQAPAQQPSQTPETPVEQSATVSKPRIEHHDPTHPGGIVVPLARTGKTEKPASGGRVDDAALLQMLRVAAERGASTVYVVAQSRPMIRVDGEIAALEAEPVLSAADIERLVAALAPRKSEGSAAGPVEWISEVPDVGRVRCQTFRDHRGPGLIFRMIPARSISADHLNLSPEIRDLCAQADGFVLVTGARSSGKSTLLSSFVDLINRTRSDHVITIESEIGFVHESRKSFISQREVQDPNAAGAAARAAVNEDPDVLVIEDLHSPESVSAALEAAESGRLVFASIAAASSTAAIEALVEMFPAGQRAAIRNSLSRTLRAVVSQVLLRKATGGRLTARELLLNSPAVAASIRDGKPSEVAATLESGQRHGMVSMSDSLAGLVRGGTVHSAEAYRRAPDKKALLACLARDGVDTSFAERLA